MTNTSLGAAKKAKNDEFYTMYPDIEREMVAYWNFNKDAFRDKVVLCPADDPEWSNFGKFFADVFDEWGLKKLICTSYAPHLNHDALFAVDVPGELNVPQCDPELSLYRGRLWVLERQNLNGDGKFDRQDMKWSYLEGDGDFRSPEVTALRDEADIVVTNPPFSLFREFLAWLMDGGVQFAVIGNINAITYKEVFHYIRDNQLWKGATANSTDMIFRVPDGADVKPDDRAKAIRMLRAMGGVYAELPDDAPYTRQGNSCWFTNIEHGKRHEWLDLDTMERNQTKRNARKVIRERGYPHYDNYDAIEVSFTEAIPSDYDGMMGVPISFLDKYNPDQFEIIGMAKRGAGDPALKSKVYTRADYPNYSDLNAGPTIFDSDGTLRNTYPRILIRNRKPEVSE